ncbi:hypothetical protein SCLCIDRAFT_138299, partial [Scleroderma citrinum Foug A]
KLSFKIIHSTTVLLPVWIETLEDFDLPIRMIPCDCSTCWNSSFDMANFILEYQAPIDSITNKCKLGLTTYALDDHEWELLCQLQDMLKILKDATLFFSCSMPNLAMVLPAIDYIDKTFTNSILQKQTLDPVI